MESINSKLSAYWIAISLTGLKVDFVGLKTEAYGAKFDETGFKFSKGATEIGNTAVAAIKRAGVRIMG